ncbi:MAG TPA: PE-PPE domain-containing protein [Mycobacterium sp.]|nr:PE-PPE domain-containing protein [Mycobacterium sp.]
MPKLALGAALLAVASTTAIGAATSGAGVVLLADQGWIMGPTSIPDPTVGSYLNDVAVRYLSPSPPWFDGQPTFPTYTFTGLTTPEEFWPMYGNMTFGDSIAAGLPILDGAIRPQLAAGEHVTVLGYSQSAAISTQEMNDLIANSPGGSYDPANLHFVLLGDPNDPIGGVLTRFDFPYGVQAFSLQPAPQHLPFLNIPLSIGPTPTGPFATEVYSGEYDGFSNFPQNPTNLLAVVNAIIGTQTVHFSYPDFDNLGDVVSLGSIDQANFYLIPTAQLPVLSPLYQLGDLGKVIGDALAPVLKLIIDWGYGNPGDPGAGIPIDGVDPIGVAGPWAVTATGHLSESTGVIGFLPMMDPLQMLAGLQYASVHSVVDPINGLLGLAGQQPLPDSVVDGLLAGYHFINDLDRSLLTGWTALAEQLGVADALGPDTIFDGAPLISGQPLLELASLQFSIVNFFGA